MEHQEFFPHTKVYFFDLDGCVYHGNRLSPGIIPLLEQLQQRGIRYAFLTNNSRQSGEEIGEKLAAMGLIVPEGTILPVTDFAGTFIRNKFGTVTVKTIGSESLERSIGEAGHRTVAWNHPAPDVVIVGRDTEFHYGKLQQITADIRAGSYLIATNPDIYHPGASGEPIPETGALLAAIEAMTGTSGECIGKPEPYIFLHGMKLFGAIPENCVMVGDNPETDILGSKRAGLKSVWITNRTSADPIVWPGGEKQEHSRPDVVVNSIEELYRLFTAGTLVKLD
ncbi:HAD-IIA family hydrolase [Paenibacillus puerhi]|uniref:HAD-IIA family hydrolase n=1 Tax=Paenibacillus puerhi TaxID=2692622 RepID=UPI0013583FD6|nr:HAD-IIA family hydrolase [Paenibacillus puerhi]